MHLATGGVTLVATGLKKKCGVCRHPMAQHRTAGVNIQNVVAPTIVSDVSSTAQQPGQALPAPQVVPARQPVPVEPGMTVAQQLKELAELKQLGALTDEEFQAEKALLLGRPAAGSRAIAATATGDSTATSTDATHAGAWHPDPQGRHELRFWDGSSWTEHVSDDGVQGTDAL